MKFDFSCIFFFVFVYVNLTGKNWIIFLYSHKIHI